MIFFLGLGLSWYFVGRRRPSFVSLAAVGLSVLFLVTILFFNRDAIWAGDDISLDVAPTDFVEINPGNDYIYGAAMANVALAHQEHDWGARYLITFFVRPIPSQIWHTKYADASSFLGVGWYQSIGAELHDSYLYLLSYPVLGWAIAGGSAWGIVTDVFWEFRFAAPVILFLVGYGIGISWRRSRQSVSALILIVVIVSVAPYLVAQDLMESGFRVIFMSVPAIGFFRLFRRRKQRMQSRRAGDVSIAQATIVGGGR